MPARLRTPRTFAALVALVLLATGTGIGVAVARPSSTEAWDARRVSDGLTRAVVTLRATATSLEHAPPTRSVTSASRLPTALLAAPAARALPQLDLAKHARAQQELGAGGQLVPGEVDGAPVALYVVDDRARVVSTGAAWEAAAPQLVDPAPTEPAAGADVPVDGALAELRAAEGVRDVQDLGGGSYLVTADLSLARVRALAPVATAETSSEVPVLAGSALPVPDDAAFASAWHLNNTGSAAGQRATPGADVSALEGWQATHGGGAVIAVLDTGFDTDHPDLGGALWTSPTETCGTSDTDGDGRPGDCHGWNFYSNSADLDNGGGDGAFHGTAVAGAAVARVGNGVGAAGLAPAATVMPLVVGRGGSVNMELANLAIRYAADHGADVVNASFGGGLWGDALTRLRSAVAYADARGVLVVASAGNASADIDAAPVYPASLTEGNVITVGSSTGTDAVARHSNTGATGVDLFAPGEYVYTTRNDGGYAYYSGTSLAAPLVAGAAALHRSLDPSTSAAQLRTDLMDTSTRSPAFAGRSVSGGRLDVAALAGAGLRFAFSGLGAQPSGSTVTAAVTVTTARAEPAPAVPDGARLSLLTRYRGETWAVTGHPLVVGGATLTTDADGSVAVPLTGADLAAGVALTATSDLPDGQYALVVQLFAGATAVGPARGAPLTVGAPTTTPPPSSAVPSSPGGTAPAGPAPSSTTAAPTRSSGSSPTPTGGSAPGPTAAPPAPTASNPGSGPVPGPTSRSTTTAPSAAPTTAAASTTTGAGPSSPSTTSPSSPPLPTSSSPRSSGSPTSSAAASAPSSSGPTTPTSTGMPTSTTAPTRGATASPGVPAPDRSYPGSGRFGVTRVSPSVVPTAGGVQVRIEGTAIPDDVVVRVGGSATATVVSVIRGAGGRAVVTVPARAAGTYDVLLSSSGSSESLAGALTYQAPGGPTTAPSTPASATATSPAPTSSSGAPSPASSAPAPPQPVVLPNGLSVTRSALWAGAPAALWSVAACETGCAGALV